MPPPPALVLAIALALPQQHLVPRLAGPIDLDGYSDEPAWQAVPPLPVVQSSPTYGDPPSERTEFRLAHDGRYLYASARMYDSDPAGIRSLSLRRDESSFSNDWFLVSLDPYRDRETTLLFATTPAGLRTDAAIYNDGSPPANMAWNAYWDAAVAVDERGWFAEMRIPLTSLRFEERDGEVIMGVTLARRIARGNEMISWPGVPHDWGAFSIYKASRMAEIVLRDVSVARVLYATPYLLGGVGRRHEPNGDGTGFLRSDEARHEPGLDVKYGVTSNLTLDVTVNPDFAQVEADDQQVNLTRFSLFFPERRRFFQERASAFEYSLGGDERLFYSRRIGLVDGSPARIYGGARLVGRAGDWDLGLLSMHTAETSVSRPENAGVVRVRRRVWNADSHVGAMATTRLGRDGSRRVAFGADALLRLFGQDYLRLSVARSGERVADVAPDSEETGSAVAVWSRDDGSFARLNWVRRGIYGLVYELEAARVGRGFDPPLGFVARNGYARGGLRLSYGWRAPAGSPLLRYSVSVDGSAYRRAGGGVESGRVGPSWIAEWRSGHTVAVRATSLYEDLERTFRIGPGADVPAGSYRFLEGAVSYTPARRRIGVSASAAAGGFYDGRRVSASLSPLWSVSRNLELSGAYQWNRVTFADRDQRFESQIGRIRALVMLDTRVSATTFVQYSSAADALALNVRIRVSPREGNDLYVVYNHAFHTDRFAYDPVRPLTDHRTLLVKYSHTFTVGL